MELVFLGTGAGVPSTKRNVTSIVLSLLAERGTIWMFDCGEGTQQQVLRSKVKLSRLEHLYVTHLHGDHLYGLPGLLTSRSHQGGETPLTVFGPRGLRRFLESALEVSGAHLQYELRMEELEDVQEGRPVYEDEQWIVTAAPLDHRVECYGYRVQQKPLPGKLDADKLRSMGVQPGPLYAELKVGRDVLLADGTAVRSSDVVGSPIPGHSVVILGDTRPTDAVVRLAEGCSVLVHEATFASADSKLAHTYYHATAEDAAMAASRAGAGALILTHISSRYQDQEADELLQEARRLFARTWLANDHWSCQVPLS